MSDHRPREPFFPALVAVTEFLKLIIYTHPMKLHTKIGLGLVLGAFIGGLCNAFFAGQPWLVFVSDNIMFPVGQVFLRLLFMTVVPIVFTSITLGVAGIGDLLCNFARCCRPVPPERIVGYITQGRGVSIHRQDCGNFLGLKLRSPERVLETSWGESDKGSYPVDLTLRAFDRSGLIRDITSVLADEGIQIWSKSYDRELNDVLSIQNEIALAITSEFGGARLCDEITSASIRPTASLDAWSLVGP